MSSSNSTSAYQKQIADLLMDLCYEQDPEKMDVIKERIETIRKLCPNCNENERSLIALGDRYSSTFFQVTTVILEFKSFVFHGINYHQMGSLSHLETGNNAGKHSIQQFSIPLLSIKFKIHVET